MPVDGEALNVEVSVEAMPVALYDAVVVPSGDAAVSGWKNDPNVMDFLREQYRHGKPILMLGGASVLLQQASIPTMLPEGSVVDALIRMEAGDADRAFEQFATALGANRQA